MRYQSLLIVTYGRSGSTLLQGILNSIDGVVVRGENHDFCWGLYQAWKSLRIANKKYGAENTAAPNNAWYGASQLSPDAFLQQARQLTANQLLRGAPEDIQCYGFKEIRYIEHLDELLPFLSFLAKLFPNPAFIFNTRSHKAVCSSDFWRKEDPQQVEQKLQLADRLFYEFARKNGNSFIARYENTIKGPQALAPLYDFLGAPFNPQKLQSILQTPHSYHQKRDTLNRALREQQRASDTDTPESSQKYAQQLKIDDASRAKVLRGSTLVVSTVKDEADRLPWFLQHYRNLGCLGFLLIDNGSSDESVRFLRDQVDVVLYHTSPEDFKGSRSGRHWVNFLVKKHALNKWVVCADADELLCWPGDSREGLEGLTRRAHRLGLNRVFTPLIDAYADKPSDELPPYIPGKPFSDICPWVDPIETTRYGWGNGRLELYGGPRGRLAGPGERPPLLSKQSLYYVEANGYQHIGAHFDTYGAPSPLVAPFLHYRFLPDFRSKCEKYIDEGTQWNDAQDYKNYIKQGLASATLKTPDSVRATCGDELHRHIDAISRLIRQNTDVGSAQLLLNFKPFPSHPARRAREVSG